MKSSDRLQPYRKKRNFSRTSEPSGSPSRGAPSSTLQYVIQKHAASRLHYDFRLELDGTLKSWAVPKGPSRNPSDKRLAVHVEDHPIEYADFEGIIPPRQYGAGTVMVWDRGQWIPEGDPKAAYAKGHLKFTLVGQKLQGRWTLVRMGGARNRDEKNWLLMKERDGAGRTGGAADSTLALAKSVKSGMSMEEIAQAKPDTWQSHGRSAAGDGNQTTVTEPSSRPQISSTPSGQKGNASCPEWITPQLATLVDAVPEGDEWIHELKYDGYRMLCRIDRGAARLFSRNGKEWTKKLSEQAAAVAGLPVDNAWLDGELVALNSDGTMSFQALQNAFDQRTDAHLVYYVFDLLFFNGADFRSRPLLERKRRLASLLEGISGDSPVRYSDHVHGQGRTIFETACRKGLEGLIAKRTDSRYLAGRNRNWVKLKCHRRQEFVIGGFTDPTGSRRGFGALLLGVYDKDQDDRFVYVGRVGTGFSDARLSALYRTLQALEMAGSPFADPPTGWDAKGVHWVKPKLVAEVRFAEWTQEGLLRQAAFLGLRDDKPAHAIVREAPVPAYAIVREAPDHPPAEETRQLKSVASGQTGRREPDPSTRSRRGSTTAPTVAGVRISHPDRVLYADDGITKLELARYYERVADQILPHLQGRPLTLVRCPEGHETGCFYQKHATDQVHEAIDRVEVEEADGRACYMVANTTAAVVALAQLGVLELHTWGATRDRLDQPDRMILDLDPAPDVPWKEVIEAALLTKTLLDELKLRSFVKTTGGKGLHVVVPLQRRHSWEEVKSFSKALAGHLTRTIPDRFTDNMAKRVRQGKVYVDFLRNSQGATAVAAYSTRAKPGAPLSIPLTWDELSEDLRSDDITLRNFEKRVARHRKDPWGLYKRVRQFITPAMRQQMGMPPH
jgi:bifunctional non-homologous end joining protein LigD